MLYLKGTGRSIMNFDCGREEAKEAQVQQTNHHDMTTTSRVGAGRKEDSKIAHRTLLQTAGRGAPDTHTAYLPVLKVIRVEFDTQEIPTIGGDHFPLSPTLGVVMMRQRKEIEEEGVFP
jgi:hypothetical protein